MHTWTSGEALDYLVCGYPISALDPQRPYGRLRGNATRAFGLANNLARQGVRVGLVVDAMIPPVESSLIAASLALVPLEAMRAASSHAHVFLLACTNLKTLHEYRPEVFDIQHPRKWVASCFDYNDEIDARSWLRGVIGMTFNNQLQAQAWTSRGLGMRIRVMPYGVDENPYIDESIVQPARPTAVWIGALRLPVLLHRLVRFAQVNPECEVRVVAGLAFDQRLPRGADGSQDKPIIEHREGPPPVEKFAALVREWCGCPPPLNLRYLGACPGENAEELGRASMALGFSRRAGQLHDDSKILDYLRSGAPVICDDGQPSHRFVIKSGHGVVVPFADTDRLLRTAYLRCLPLCAVEQKRRVAVEIREAFGWQAVAKRVAAAVKEDLSTSEDDNNHHAT